MAVMYTSKQIPKFDDNVQCKMWETEIIMHLQTLKQMNSNGVDEKTKAQVQGAIDENVKKIRQCIPNYELSYTIDNVEDEVHSAYDPSHKGHLEDTEGLNSIYSGEKKYDSNNDVTLKEREQLRKKKLNETTNKSTHTSDGVIQQYDADTQAFLNRLNENENTESDKQTDYSEYAHGVFAKIHNSLDVSKTAEEYRSDQTFIDDGMQMDYDLVSIPSKGECYKNKKKKLSVSYLTAYDENMITSPNLYEENLINEYLLKHKILDKDFNVMDLTSGDADAILVWLRKTSYGINYPVTVTDPQTRKQFDAVINLNDIKMRDFTLVGDENGYFDYHCELSGADIKFKFLTLADSKALTNTLKIESSDVRKNLVNTLLTKIKNVIDADTELKGSDKNILNNSLGVVEKWTESKSKQNNSFLNTITDALERLIVSVNGNTDRDFVKKFIYKMPALDSLKFRKYVDDNEPRMDFMVEVERPQDLGGGLIKTFLEWDEYVFTNTANL